MKVKLSKISCENHPKDVLIFRLDETHTWGIKGSTGVYGCTVHVVGESQAT